MKVWKVALFLAVLNSGLAEVNANKGEEAHVHQGGSFNAATNHGKFWRMNRTLFHVYRTDGFSYGPDVEEGVVSGLLDIGENYVLRTLQSTQWILLFDFPIYQDRASVINITWPDNHGYRYINITAATIQTDIFHVGMYMVLAETENCTLLMDSNWDELSFPKCMLWGTSGPVDGKTHPLCDAAFYEVCYGNGRYTEYRHLYPKAISRESS